MQNIFIGMLFVFLNFSLDIGSLRIGLIPTFLGYIYIAKGLLEVTGFSDNFSKVAPYVKGMVVYSGICYAMDLLGISFIIGMPIDFVLGLISTVVSLFISHGIIMGIRDIEIAKVQNLNAGQLYSTWKLLAIVSLAVYLLYIIPVLAVICMIAGFMIAVYYLSIFNKTKNLYYGENPTG